MEVNTNRHINEYLQIAWVLIIVATDPYYLYAARFLAGLGGGGIFVVTPIYVAEIADDQLVIHKYPNDF